MWCLEGGLGVLVSFFVGFAFMGGCPELIVGLCGEIVVASEDGGGGSSVLPSAFVQMNFGGVLIVVGVVGSIRSPFAVVQMSCNW